MDTVERLRQIEERLKAMAVEIAKLSLTLRQVQEDLESKRKPTKQADTVPCGHS
jgi:hypothetical protein